MVRVGVGQSEEDDEKAHTEDRADLAAHVDHSAAGGCLVRREVTGRGGEHGGQRQTHSEAPDEPAGEDARGVVDGVPPRWRR